jgi:hypothetical protein
MEGNIFYYIGNQTFKSAIMNSHSDKSQESQRKTDDNPVSTQPASLIVNQRPESLRQLKLQETMNNSQQIKKGAMLQASANQYATSVVQKKEEHKEEEVVQKKENETGLPDHLKAGVENLSGLPMDDVRVHFNSNKPAAVQAKAYAQGKDIHVATGQEKHLPHEAWHVVQQQQGRVKPTMQMKDNMNVNDDAALEQEADIMGAKANQNNKEASATKGMTMTAQGPIQMAGHAGVMIFGNDGKLFKRIEHNEADEFSNVMALQSAEDRLGNKSLTHGAFPRVYRVLSASQLNADEVKQSYGTGKNVTDWLKKGKADDHYVEMESLGGRDVDVLDFKIGTATADHEELMGNYGKSQKAADKKVAKMAKIDTTTETASHGLRDSDAAKASIVDNIKRIVGGKFVPTLTDITSRVARDNRAYTAADQAIIDLRNIRDYIRSATTVYIASSLVMQWNKDRTFKELDRVVLIDLAHPMPDEMAGFEEAKAGMLLGIANLERILLGTRPSVMPARQ